MSVFRLIHFLVFLGLLLIGTTCSAAPQLGAWRTISRNAVGHFKKGEYEAALSGFQRALVKLRKEYPEAEEQYDLQLMVAETYRRQKRFVQAEMVFKSLEPVIKSGKYADPLLRCRFLKRRADLSLSQNHTRAALADQLEALSIRDRYFVRDTKKILEGYADLTAKLAENKSWNELHLLMLRWRSDLIAGTLPEELRLPFDSAIDEVHKSANGLISVGKLKEAHQLLNLFEDVDTWYDRLIECRVFHSINCAVREPDLAIASLAALDRSLKTVEAKPFSKQVLGTLFKAHLTELAYYEQLGQSGPAERERQEIEHLLSRHPLDPTEREFLSLEARLRLTMNRSGRWQCPRTRMPLVIDENLKEIERLVAQISSLTSRPGVNSTLRRSMELSVCRGHFCVASIYIERNMTEQAEQELLKIPRSRKEGTTLALHRSRLGRLYTLLADDYLRSKNQLKARQCVAIAHELLKGERILEEERRMVDAPFLHILARLDRELKLVHTLD